MLQWTRLYETWTRLIHRKPILTSRVGKLRRSHECMSILLVTQDDSLRHSLCALGHVYKWEVICAATREAAIGILRSRQMPLVICDEDAPEDWRKTVRAMAFLPQSTCILLASPARSESLQTEVRRHHGYDIIAKPLRFQEVADRVTFAWTWYKSGSASWWGPPPDTTPVPPGLGSDR